MLQEIVTRQGTRLHGFEKAKESLRDFGYEFNSKRVERQTERIGQERVAEREELLERYEQLTLTERCEGPPEVKPPDVVSVGYDGGRLQLTEVSENGTHWRQYGAADLRVLKSEERARDPASELPEIFRDSSRMSRLVSEVSHKIAGTEAPENPADAGKDHATESRITDGLLSEPPSQVTRKTAGKRPSQPETIRREVLASRTKTAPQFGKLMAAYAWTMGFFQALRKGFVGDGSSAVWGIYETHFQPRGFVAILDFIHALTYVFNAAMAGRPADCGWKAFQTWIEWVWQGRVADVIRALELRQQELGEPQPTDGDSHPRQVLQKSLTYLRNQQDRMNYPEYRRLGLAITSCHIESTIKQLNYRVKGSEMFWAAEGAEALLQLSADLLSDSRPLDSFWQRRAKAMTGQRAYKRSAI